MARFKNVLRRCAVIGLIPFAAQISCRAKESQTVSEQLASSGDETTNERADGLSYTAKTYRIKWGNYVNRTPISREQQLEAIRKDAATIGERERVFVRYLTLTHLYNLGVPDDELEITRAGIIKGINSLSLARQLVLPKAIDQEKTVYRVDLRDYRWSRRMWDVVARRSDFDIVGTDSNARQVQNLLNTRHPMLRADTFLSTAMEPDIYYFILETPRSIRTLENRLGISRFRNILGGRAFRVGFTGSGVSQQNRILERHTTPFGYYWRSIDFAPSNGRRDRNIFAFPLDNGLRGVPGFREAGGEIIYSLPNGLQAYVLVDGNGNRINEAPTNVVADPSRPNMAIQNGISCHRCHNAGMIGAKSVKDEIVPNLEANQNAFRKFEADLIRSIYTNEATIRDAYGRDTQRYKEAMDRLGLATNTADPINTVVQRFEAQHIGIDLDTVAAELGISKDSLKERISQSPRLARDIGILTSGGRVQREVLRDVFPVAVRILQLGFTSGLFSRNSSVSYGDSEISDDLEAKEASIPVEGGAAPWDREVRDDGVGEP